MKLKATIGFGGAASVAALIGAAALSPWFLGADRLVAGWAARGFLAMALPGIVGGMWLACEFGRSGSRFVVALGVGVLARLVLAAISAFGAAKLGGTATTGLLLGLSAGFVPVTVLEMIWFSLAQSESGAGSESRG